jgi:hypothetical protein
MKTCVGELRWTPPCGVLGRARIYIDTTAACVLAWRHPSHPDDEAAP